MQGSLRTYVAAMSALSLGLLVGSTCDDGDDDAVAAAPAAASARSHAGAVQAGPFNIPKASGDIVLASAVFTPTGSSDVLVLAQVEGTATIPLAGTKVVALVIRDAGGRMIGRGATVVSADALSGQPILLSTTLVNGALGASLPVSAYTLELVGNDQGDSAAWNMSNVRFVVHTLEGVESVAASPNFS